MDHIEILDKRMAIYQSKMNETDPLGQNSWTRYEAMQHTVEALQILRKEMLAKMRKDR